LYSSLAALVLTSVPGNPNGEETGTVVRILFTNNSNGKLVDCNCPNDPYGGLAERVGLVREYGKYFSDFLLLDSGGYLGLSKVGRKRDTVFRLMEIMGYDALGISDQELYYGLGSFLSAFGKWRDDIVSASLFTAGGRRVFEPYRIFTVKGVRLAVIGLLAEETFRFFPGASRDFTVEDPDTTLRRYMPELMRSADYIIVLSQMGRKKDEEIAKRWDDIDLIIGGHSQTLLEKALRVGKCRIVQAGKNGGRVGEIVLVFDEAKRMKKFSYKLFEVNERYTIPEDIKPLLKGTVSTGPRYRRP